MWDLLRRLGRAPPAGSSAADAEATRSQRGLEVTCHLRASGTGYPTRWTQGMLRLSPSGATWTRFWSVKRDPVLILNSLHVVEVRDAQARDWNIKQGLFEIIICDRGGDGRIELAVPRHDVRTVTDYIARGR